MYNSEENRIIDGVRYLSNPEDQVFNDELYINLRKKEGRLYNNDELKVLPDVKDGHPLRIEWEIRKKTAQKLISYFSGFKEKNILEIGCGNGWLSNMIAEKTDNNITALDLNEFELKQAANVFRNKGKLTFIYGNILENIFTQNSFDFILFAGSIQYFNNLPELFNRLFNYLANVGEIHIVDSNFYKKNEIQQAKMRTKKYYESVGFAEMIKYYHHHDWNEIKKYNHKLMNPYGIRFSKMFNSVSGTRRNIFPWIAIKKP